VKLSKKTVSCPMAATTTTCIAIEASGHKGAVGALGSKGAACALGSKDATSVKKLLHPFRNAMFLPLALWQRHLRLNLKSCRLMVKCFRTLRPSLRRCQSLKLHCGLPMVPVGLQF
jgi:hypothetical protein